ncbi:MAG: hypothetical protein ACPLXA_01245 [Moorellaceae bacterium]
MVKNGATGATGPKGLESMHIYSVLEEIAGMDTIAREMCLQEVAKETKIRITLLRKELEKIVAKKEEEIRRQKSLEMEKYMITATAITTKIWEEIRKEEPALPSVPPEGVFVLSDFYMYVYQELPDSEELVAVGPVCIPIQEVPGTVVLSARDPWGRWVHVPVPTLSLLSSGKLCQKLSEYGIVPIIPSLWARTIREAWLAVRDQILEKEPEPIQDVAMAAVRALWDFVATNPEQFQLRPSEKADEEIFGTTVDWDEKQFGFRPQIFQKVLEDAGIDPRAAKYALWARGWIKRDKEGNFSLNLAARNGGLRNTRFVVVCLTAAAKEEPET